MDEALQPHQLEARGLGTQVFGPPTPTTNPLVGEGIMAISSNTVRAQASDGMYTAEEDIIETLPDGRTIQVAVKGAQIPMAEAVRLGLVKKEQQQGPTEKKPAKGSTEVKGSLAPTQTVTQSGLKVNIQPVAKDVTDKGKGGK